MIAFDLTPYLELFKLGWQSDPSQLPHPRGADHLTIETAAWLVEINEQLTDLAAELEITLVLMGGNAAALRMGVASQRGSRDNDYLTDASEAEIDALVAAFAERFVQLAPYFVPELYVPEGARRLPLCTYHMNAPAVYAETFNGMHHLKVEFHVDIDDLPPSETVISRHFALPQPVRARVPRVPYQVALKLLTLTDPPVGLDVGREGVLPRQVYDLAGLVPQVEGDEAWGEIRAYASSLYGKECEVNGIEPADGEPWAGIEQRLARWARLDEDQELAHAIETFQQTQVPSAARIGRAAWRARMRMIQFAARCAASGRDSARVWDQACAIEARLPARPGPKREMKPFRDALGNATGIKTNAMAPRDHFWEGIVVTDDPASVLDEIASQLP
jgi:hypothetical protein